MELSELQELRHLLEIFLDMMVHFVPFGFSESQKQSVLQAIDEDIRTYPASMTDEIRSMDYKKILAFLKSRPLEKWSNGTS